MRSATTSLVAALLMASVVGCGDDKTKTSADQEEIRSLNIRADVDVLPLNVVNVQELEAELAKLKNENNQISSELENKKKDSQSTLENLKNLSTEKATVTDLVNAKQNDLDNITEEVNSRQNQINEYFVCVELYE